MAGAALIAFETTSDVSGSLAKLHASGAHGLVSAVSWVMGWDLVEGQQNRLDTRGMGNIVSAAAADGYASTFIVVPGYKAPKWVLPLCQTISFAPGAGPGGAAITMPVPWDPTLLSLYTGMIRGLGQGLGSNPHLAMIQSTGGGIQGEMQLPHDSNSLQRWAQAGYTDARLLDAWKTIINAWHAAFPSTPVSLAIEEPLGQGNSNVLQPLIAWCQSTWGSKQRLQQNGLKASASVSTGYGADLLAASAWTTVGWQMNGAGSAANGNLGQAFNLALASHASFVEVYGADVTNPANRLYLENLVAGRQS